MKKLLLATSAIIALAAPAHAQTVVVDAPPAYSYDAGTVHQLQVRNEWGRYLTFSGISTHSW
jgi:hypothetical protein